MKTARPALLMLISALLGATLSAPPMAAGPVLGERDPDPTAASMHGHCAPAIVTPVAGEPGAYRIQTPHGTTIAHRAPVLPRTAGPVAEIRVLPTYFDADGDTLGTMHDTILVAPGTTVRWVRDGEGFHTVTSGVDSGDPGASSEYNYIFDDATTSAERVFTAIGRHDYFCYIHEPVMMGSIIVTSATAGVGPSGVLTRAAFTRPPAPNPTRGALAFAIGLPRATPVSLTVHDVAGRLVARLRDGALPAGEHPFRWDGRGTDGRLAQSGRYFVRLEAGAVRETRAVSIVH
ncbi:MAG TPA: FlgD immunoglobulin-like domain containing protein [Methylomirabilota bacterium]|nr:FlgD immunoglobulin-like domain containing protein [Methylomirabilota bacterium]